MRLVAGSVFSLRMSGSKMQDSYLFSADQSAISNSVVEGGKATNVTINGGIVPALANFDNAPILLAVIGLVLTAILVVKTSVVLFLSVS